MAAIFPAPASSLSVDDVLLLLLDESAKIAVERDITDYQKANLIFMDEMRTIKDTLPGNELSTLMKMSLKLNTDNLNILQFNTRTEGFKTFFFSCQKVLLNMSRASNLEFVRKNAQSLTGKIVKHFVIPNSEVALTFRIIMELSSFWLAFDQLNTLDKPDGIVKMATARAVSILRTVGLTTAITNDMDRNMTPAILVDQNAGSSIYDSMVSLANLGVHSDEVPSSGIRAARLSSIKKVNSTEVIIRENATSSFVHLSEDGVYDIIARVFSAIRLSASQKDKFDDELFTQDYASHLSHTLESTAIYALYLMDTDSLSSITVQNIAHYIMMDRNSILRLGELIELILIVNSIITFLVYSDAVEPFNLEPKEILKSAFCENTSFDKADIKISDGCIELIVLSDRNYKSDCCMSENSCIHGLNHREFLSVLESCDKDLIVK